MKLHISTLALVLALAITGALAARGASALTISGTTAASTKTNVAPDTDLSVTTNAIGSVTGADQAMKNALAAQFPGWTITYSTAASLQGTLNVSVYSPVVLGDDWGGAKIDATYTTGTGDPAVAALHWIQLVTTNLPLNGATSPYIDPYPNDDTLPYYWTLAEDANTATVSGSCGNFTQGAKSATTYHYYDCSSRLPTSGSADTTWSGELLLAAQTGANAVTVYGGITWGWTLSDPVPEPAPWVLLTVGFLGLGVVRRRSRRTDDAI